MIFRVGGRAVAGMSLLWVGRAGLRADRHLGEVVQSYIELNLAAHYAALPADDLLRNGNRIGAVASPNGSWTSCAWSVMA